MLPGASVLGGLQPALGWLERRRQSNIKEFIDVLANELKYQSNQIMRLVAESEAQKTFVEEELPGLILEALRRAEQCRAKDRIGRLAKILARAAEVGSRDGSDLVEQMMVIAVGLSDAEVLVLQLAIEEFRAEKAAHPQEAERAVAARAWMRIAGKVPHHPSEDEMLSTGAKLESFGLAIRVEPQAWETPVYRPLQRGRQFVEYMSTNHD